jgi:hypothetical protein
VAGAEFFPAHKSDTGELFAGREKLDLVCFFNGRGGQIRTDDPLLPKRKTLFWGKLDFGNSGESIEEKGFILFLKAALNEKISICAASAHVSACGPYRLIFNVLWPPKPTPSKIETDVDFRGRAADHPEAKFQSHRRRTPGLFPLNTPERRKPIFPA